MRRSTKKSFIDAAKRRHAAKRRQEAELKIPIKINDKVAIYVSREKLDEIGVENIIKEYKLKCNIK